MKQFLLFTILAITFLSAITTVYAQSFYVLKAINFDGNRMTKEKVLLRELSVALGDTILLENVEQIKLINQERLLNLKLFNEVKIQLDTTQTDCFLQISLLERFPIMPEPNIDFADRNFNVWWNEQNRSFSRINIGTTLTHFNLTGHRDKLSLELQAGYTKIVGLNYEFPFLDHSMKHGITLGWRGIWNKEIAYQTANNKLLFYNDQDQYMLRHNAASLGYIYRPAFATTHNIFMNIDWININPKVLELNKFYLNGKDYNERQVSLNYEMRLNHLDNWDYPLKGQRIVGSGQLGYALKGKHLYGNLKFQFDDYRQLYKKWYTAIVFRSKWNYIHQPYYIYRQSMGYESDYVRGYEYYVMDGDAFALMRLNLKRTLLDYKIKLPIKYFQVIPLKIYAKIFGDIGYNYNKLEANSPFNQQLLRGGGIGIDIITLYDLKLRIEYSWNHLGENALFLHQNGE